MARYDEGSGDLAITHPNWTNLTELSTEFSAVATTSRRKINLKFKEQISFWTKNAVEKQYDGAISYKSIAEFFYLATPPLGILRDA